MTTVDRDESILSLHGHGHSRGHIASIVSCSTQTVSRVLSAHGIGPAWAHDPDEQGDPPKPGEPTYKKGDCLMCHKNTYKHPSWPNGKCPICHGTGKYPKAIMQPYINWQCPECGHITRSRNGNTTPPNRCHRCSRRGKFVEV